MRTSALSAAWGASLDGHRKALKHTVELVCSTSRAGDTFTVLLGDGAIYLENLAAGIALKGVKGHMLSLRLCGSLFLGGGYGSCAVVQLRLADSQ